MIELQNIHKHYGQDPVLQDLSFTGQLGQIIAIVGRNGSGKSTLLKIMAGIIKPDAGLIRYFGEDIFKNPRVIRKYCGYLPQSNPLMEDLTVRDNLRLWGASKAMLSPDLAQAFMLDDLLKKPVKELSGGMKRRVSFLAASIHQPPILLLDEPSLALDMENRTIIRNWISSYREKNGLIVMVSHDQEEINLADQLIEL